MDVGGNMNPFLFDDPIPAASEAVDMSNPFLNGGGFDFSADSYSGINPFSDQIDESTAAASMNFFGDASTYAPEMNPFGVSAASPNLFDSAPTITQVSSGVSDFDIFGTITPQEIHPSIDFFGEPLSQPTKPPPPRPPSPSHYSGGMDNNIPTRPPPPRPPPPSKETKDLLQTVIGAMEATTDTLRDKLNATHTPCPSPGKGHASRSPTPDIQITAPEKEPDAFSTIFGQTIEELSDPEGEDQETSATNATAETVETEPTPSGVQPSAGDIDLFGEPIVQTSKTKTTQDILNLFNKPSESNKPQFDLLSDDLLSDQVKTEDEESSKGEVQEASPFDLLSANIDQNADISQATEMSSVDVSDELVASTDKADEQILDSVTSPEHVSEKTESDSTVINALAKDQQEADTQIEDSMPISHDDEEDNSVSQLAAFESEKSKDVEFDIESINETVSNEESIPAVPDQLTENGMPEETSVTDIFGAPIQTVDSEMDGFGAPPSRTSEVSIADIFGSPAPEPTPSEVFGETVLPQEPVVDDIFGASNATSASSAGDIFGAPNATSVSSAGDIFGAPNATSVSSAGDIFGAPNATSVSSAGDIFGAPNATFVSSAGDIFGESQMTYEANNIENVDLPSNAVGDINDIFGTQVPEVVAECRKPSLPAFEVPNVADIFGVGAQDFESTSPSPFFSVEETRAPHPTPSSATSTGFDIFGEEPIPVSEIQTVPSGADSTGATLFETQAPAPNVGMSLFGGGEEASLDIFAESAGNTMINPFAPPSSAPTSIATLAVVSTACVKESLEEDFDAFSARFDNVTTDSSDTSFDPFTGATRAVSPWGGDSSTGAAPEAFGFGDDAKFDPFLALNEPPPVPQSTPRRLKRDDSKDSDETPMNIVIRPTAFDGSSPIPPVPSPVPILAPPPAALSSFTDSSRFNPFDKSGEDLAEKVTQGITAFPGQGELQRSESQETPPTPLFEEDQSVPLEPFLRTSYDGRTWEMHLRQPNKKKITGQRFWKKVFVKLTDAGALQLFNNVEDKEPFQELPLQPCYSVSDIGAQQFDQFGKIFTVKIQYIFYKERPGVRPGQISKAERITNKLSKFAQYAIAGDYEGVKEFASDVRKLGMPVEHAPQISQLLKLGTQTYEDLKLFSSLIEEFMFKLTVHRDRALTYKSEEVQLTAVDEIFVEQDLKGVVNFMVARVRIFFLGFLTGMPEVDLGINDLRKQGHEVVGRHDIIPVITEEWIRLEDIEFHCTVNQEEFEKTRHIKFKPPDACYIELMRYRVRPPKNRELPLQIKTKFIIQGKRVDIQSEILVPGFSGRKLGQVPCEDVAVRFPLPECWIYMFRVEKHFRYGSVKSAHRRTGKVKGMERFKGAVDAPEAALMEVTSGQAKYEHQHRAIVWRMSRLPKEGQGAYSVHQFTCKMNLTAYDQVPPTLDRFCVLEFTMPATTVSHCVMRSVSVTSEEPPEKYVRYLARHEYKVEIEFSSGSGPNEYIAATMKEATNPTKEPEPEKPKPTPVLEESSSDESN